MKFVLILPFLLGLLTPLLGAELTLGAPSELLVEGHPSPATITTSEPRFSWRIEAKGRGQLQSAYRIMVATDAAELKDEGQLTWDSGKLDSGNSLFLPYAGPALVDGSTYHWRVQLWDAKKEEQPWSEPAQFTFSKTAPAPELSAPAGSPLATFHSSNENLNALFLAATASREESVAGTPSFGAKNKPWSADLHLTARSYLFNQNLSSYYQRWMTELTAGVTKEAPLFPAMAPSPKDSAFPAPGYSEAGVVVPFALWQMTGDLRLVQKHYDASIDYMKALRTTDPDFTGKAFGKDLGDRGHQNDPTSADFLALVFAGLDCRVLIETSSAISHMPYIMQHNAWFEHIRNGFQKRFLDEDGELTETSQTARILALRFSLLPPEKKQSVADALAIDIAENGLKSGIFGTAHVLPVLSWTGHHEEAVALAQSLFSENAETLDVALAANAEWMLSFLAGIGHETPGFKTVRLTPLIPQDGSLTEVKASHLTPYGKVAIHWATTEKGLTAEVTIPPNTNAVITLPAPAEAVVTEGGQSLEDSFACQLMATQEDKVKIIAQSGTYQFEIVNP